jgi:uncharacterized protein (DUF433 family)
MKFTRITHNPTVMGGKPCIRGLRVTVGTIVGLLAAGESRERILEAYPYLEPADLDECLNLKDLAVFGQRRNEPSRPFRDFLEEHGS